MKTLIHKDRWADERLISVTTRQQLQKFVFIADESSAAACDWLNRWHASATHWLCCAERRNGEAGQGGSHANQRKVAEVEVDDVD